ncbi:MAG: DUF5979 domain-containing protein, partial [Oscillospiraceae bacterium]|nr:DUF5979 domain-containing protein [Oscillospiraceae bacterium]
MKRLRGARPIALLLACVLALSAAASGTMAWADFSQHRTNIAEGEGPGMLRSALLQKYESGTKTPVSGVEFALYRVNFDGTATPMQSYITGRDGQILASDLKSGDYYWQESRPAPGFLPEIEDGQPKKYPFSLPGENEQPVRVTAYNTRRQGKLALRKTVANSDESPLTQAQKDLLFEFTVTFLDGKSYTYSIDGGAAQTIVSGGKIYLKSGQTAQFNNMPVGIGYVITETPVAHYVTTSENHAANVPEGGITAAFINTYNPAPPNNGSLTITKTVIGEGADPEQDFDFTALIGGETHSFTLKHDESKTFDGLPLGTAYVVSEVNVPQGYTANHDRYIGTISAAGAAIALPFVNHYEGENPPDLPGNLEVTKTIAGPGVNLDKAFTFEIAFTGRDAPQSPQTFTLKHNEKKTFTGIPRGVAYTITESAESGYRADFSIAGGVIS